MPKNNPLRVSIQFSKDDDCQTRAAEILNEKGRKKAMYISQAIEAYEKKHELSGMSIAEIKEVVNDLIKQNLKLFALSNLKKSEETVAIVTDDVKKIKNEGEQSFAVPMASSVDYNLPDLVNEETSKEEENGKERALQDFVSEALQGFMNF